MTDSRDLEELMRLGAGRPAPKEVAELYQQAFREFGAEMLWNRRPSEQPTIAQVLVIARSLRRDGNMKSRPLAVQIEEACLPLSRVQTEILSLLAAHRNPESYVAGATALNVEGPRFSGDIGIFHDREEAVARAADADAALLAENGFGVRWLRREPGIHAALVQRCGESTKLEWVRDSDFRFFPAIKDDLFGYRLHVFDLATNKALAAAGRQEPRDVLDLIYIHDHHVPLGAVIWAAVAKDPGYSPESLIAEIRRNARYRADDYADLALTEPVDAGAVARRLREILDAADAFVRAMPAGSEGLAFLQGDQPVQPDPENLDTCVKRPGQRRGHWPSSSEIGSAMVCRDPREPKP